MAPHMWEPSGTLVWTRRPDRDRGLIRRRSTFNMPSAMTCPCSRFDAVSMVLAAQKSIHTWRFATAGPQGAVLFGAPRQS